MNDGEWVDRGGVTLWFDCGEFALQAGWWQAFLGLARHHGWTSRGTLPPPDYAGWDGDPDCWDGRYWPALGQQVSENDARALGAALGRAVADIPDHDSTLARRAQHPDVNALELLSGPERKEILGWFLGHCECSGGFDIVDYDYLTASEA
jgi:hypothetical protein